MKNINKILMICFIIIITCFSICFADEEKFIVSDTYTLSNNSDHLVKTAEVTILIGQKDFVSYQDDESVNITPPPDSRHYDDYGNLYVTYDLGSYLPGRSIQININRVYEPGSYSGDIDNYVRTSSTVNDENRIYTKPSTKIESDNAEIIAKAKEITYNVTSDYKRAKAIYEFVNSYMTYDKNTSYANKGAYSALVNKRGVCEEYATLYAALCRAVGIPCRVISGYQVNKKQTSEAQRVWSDEVGKYVDIPAEYDFSIVGHDWNEVWFDNYGWLPVDTCVTYVNTKGEKTTTFNSFCKIDGREYMAESIYTGDNTRSLYSEAFSYDNQQEFNVYELVAQEKHSFKDCDDFPWAVDSINTLYDMGVIKGFTDDEFGPAGNITRIDFICMLSRILQSLEYKPVSKGQIYYFMDYDKNHYSKPEYDYFMRLMEDNYPGLGRFAVGMEGMTSIFGNSLNMNTPITRAEVVKLMDPFMKYTDLADVKFNDVAGHRFESSIIKGYSNGLIKGYDDGSFKPDNPIRRAEIAVILDRYVGVKTQELF